MTNTIDLLSFLHTRRSVRRFKPDPVPDSVIREILHTATFAPSAHNRQPWRFVVLTDLRIKTNLADAMEAVFKRDLEKDGLSVEEIQKRIKRSRERMTNAPVVILLCMDMTEMDDYPDKKRRRAEFRMALQSVANAGMQMLLAAHAQGLSGVWVCSPLFAQETIQETLKLRKTWEPQAMFFIGYPSETPALRERKKLEEVVIFQ